MNETERRIVALNLEALPCPSNLPRPWSEMTPSEQAMTLWFIRRSDYLSKMQVARHALAYAIQRNGGSITEAEANDIWSLFTEEPQV